MHGSGLRRVAAGLHRGYTATQGCRVAYKWIRARVAGRGEGEEGGGGGGRTFRLGWSPDPVDNRLTAVAKTLQPFHLLTRRTSPIESMPPPFFLGSYHHHRRRQSLRRLEQVPLIIPRRGQKRNRRVEGDANVRRVSIANRYFISTTSYPDRKYSRPFACPSVVKLERVREARGFDQ